MRTKFWGRGLIKLIIGIFFIISVISPLITMMAHMGEVPVGEILTDSQFVKSALNSVLVAVTATLISITLAFVLAWCIVKSNIRHKEIWSILFTLPMLIPSISHGMGLVMLLGTNGVLTNLFHLNFSIYGFGGIVLGSVMYSFPVAFLMLVDVLKYEDGSAYEAASVLGIPKRRQITAILLPYLRKPLISVVFATFTLIVTDYGVPLMVGGKFSTLPVLMYNEVIGRLDFGKGSVIGACLLLPAIVAFLFDLFNSDKGNLSFVVKGAEIAKNKIRDAFSYLFCTAAGIFVTLPIVTFILLTFVKKYPIDMQFSLDNITKTLDMSAGKFLLNSLLIALCVAIIGVVISYFTAYMTARTKGRSSKILHLIAITSLAIPGIVLGLSYVLFFNGSFIYGTIAILILVNLIHFFASPYLMAYNSFGKLNENLEDVGRTLGISRARMVKDVFIPQTKGTMLEMFSYFFVNSMITISAVSFLKTSVTMPISLMINQFEAQMLLECSAFVSLLILIVNLLLKGAVYLAKRIMLKKEVA